MFENHDRLFSEQIPTHPVQQRRVRLHRLLSRKVLDSGGRFAGRVEEVRGHVRNGRCLVQEYVLGREALLERLSVSELSLAALPIAIRLAGLDRDPGWIPAAGHAVAFRFA